MRYQEPGGHRFTAGAPCTAAPSWQRGSWLCRTHRRTAARPHARLLARTRDVYAARTYSPPPAHARACERTEKGMAGASAGHVGMNPVDGRGRRVATRRFALVCHLALQGRLESFFLPRRGRRFPCRCRRRDVPAHVSMRMSTRMSVHTALRHRPCRPCDIVATYIVMACIVAAYVVMAAGLVDDGI